MQKIKRDQKMSNILITLLLIIIVMLVIEIITGVFSYSAGLTLMRISDAIFTIGLKLKYLSL